MTWYLGYVYGGKSREAGRAERDFNQFIVERELRALGVECWCGHKIEFKRTGKNRRPEPHEKPYLLNYIFANISPDLFFRAVQIKNMASTLMPIDRREIPAFEKFRKAVDDEYEAAIRVKANIKANHALVAEYKAGQALRYINGGFGETLMRFKRLVERAGDLHPKVLAEMDMMGRVVTVEVDPLSVRAAE